MRTLLSFLVFLLSLLPASAGERIVVAAFEYPPIYQNEVRKGLSGDIVVAAFKAVAIDVDMRFLPPKRMVMAVSNGDAVCGIGGRILFGEPDAAESVTVSSVVQYVSQIFLYDARRYPEGVRYQDPGELAGRYRIGVLNGSGIMHYLEANGLKQLDRNVAHEGSARQLHASRIDLWAIVDVAGLMYVNKLFPEEARFYRYTQSYNIGDVSVVFSKRKDPSGFYQGQFEKGLGIIKKNGTYFRIFASYYGGRAAINRDALVDDMKAAFRKN